MFSFFSQSSGISGCLLRERHRTLHVGKESIFIASERRSDKLLSLLPRKSQLAILQRATRFQSAVDRTRKTVWLHLDDLMDILPLSQLRVDETCEGERNARQATSVLNSLDAAQPAFSSAFDPAAASSSCSSSTSFSSRAVFSVYWSSFWLPFLLM